MKNRKLIDRDEIYFLVFFSNFFIGMLLLTIKYNFDSIQAFFVFANIIAVSGLNLYNNDSKFLYFELFFISTCIYC